VISRGIITALTVTALVAVTAGRLLAQMPKVGDMAPDFTLKGSTKDGLLPKPIHLADFRGQTVVLAFFPKSRTKG
jgi:peroxiredoxin Q/BCP